jgi:hypothetical protein
MRPKAWKPIATVPEEIVQIGCKYLQNTLYTPKLNIHVSSSFSSIPWARLRITRNTIPITGPRRRVDVPACLYVKHEYMRTSSLVFPCILQEQKLHANKNEMQNVFVVSRQEFPFLSLGARAFSFLKSFFSPLFKTIHQKCACTQTAF